MWLLIGRSPWKPENDLIQTLFIACTVELVFLFFFFNIFLPCSYI